jgi:hypothetical protein
MGLKAVASTSLSDATLSNPTITGTVTLTQASGIESILAESAIPLIGLSSGSVSAAGAISAITALPLAYPHAFCYFPANALATSIAAGWHYCTFSTTTAGTAFLNTWTPGTAPPTVPTSTTAVTDGKGAFTGVTTEQGIIIPIAAGGWGPNGGSELFARMAYTNSAGTKTLRFRHSGAAGTIYFSSAPTTTVACQFTAWIKNTGSAATQVGWASGVVSTATTSQSAGATLGTVDTTAATDVRITVQRNTATDNAIIEFLKVRQVYGA